MLRKILLTGLGLVLTGVAHLSFNAVALRLFGERVTGQINVAFSLGMLLVIPASTAFGATVVRYVGLAKGAGDARRAAWVFRTLFGATLLVALIAVGVVFIFAERIAASRGVSQAFVWYAGVFSLAYAVYLFVRNVLYALDRVPLYTALELLSAVAFFLGLGLAAFLDEPGLMLFAFIAQYLTFAVAAICSRALPRWRGALARDHQTARVPTRDLASYSLLSLLGTATSLSMRELAVFLAPSFAGLEGAAYLALSLSLLLPLNVIPRMLRSVFMAHGAHTDGAGDRARFVHPLNEASHWLMLATIPTCMGLIILASPLFVLMGGAPTPERLLVFRLLVAGATVDVLATPVINALAGSGRVKINTIAAVLAFAAALLTWWITGRHLGLVGLALGAAIAFVIRSIIPMAHAYRELGVRYTRRPGMVLILVGLGLVAVACEHLTARPLTVGIAYGALAVVVLSPSLCELFAMLSRAHR